jgi:hypothetical protein
VRRSVAALVIVAACGPGVGANTPPGPDASSFDASTFQRFRPGVASTRVGDRVAWTVESVGCPLEGSGCPAEGPSLLEADVDGTELLVRASSPRGAAALVGATDELFALLRVDDPTERDQLVRFSLGNGNGTVIVPSLQREILAIDDTFVYWAADGGGIWRSSRTGDGDDAAVVVSAVFPRLLAVDGGWVYWLDAAALRRAPTSGGAVETWLQGSMDTLAVASSVAYVATYPGRQILRIDGPDSTTVLADVDNAAFAMRLDSDEVFWIDGAGGDRLRAVTTTGGTARTVSQPVRWDFVLTPGAILHGFTDTGFESIPR